MGNLESNPPLPKVKNDPQETKTNEDENETDFHLNTSSFPQMTCFDLTTKNGDFKPDFSWKINDISQLLAGKKTARVKSSPFTWSNYQVQAQAKMDVKSNGQVVLSMRLEEISLVIIEPVPAVYYVLKDQSGSTKHRGRAINYTLPVKFNYSLPFQVTLTHKDWLTHRSYNANDSIAIEIYVESPSIAQHVHSTDGTLKWAIDQYSKRKEMALEQLVLYEESPYFYTGPSKYRVRVRMWLNGCKEYEGKGLTAEVCFLPGEFDTDLPLTFNHRTTITLFNRKDPQRNISKTVDKDTQRSKSYFIDLCKQEDVGNVLYNDAVFYKVTIKPSISTE